MFDFLETAVNRFSDAVELICFFLIGGMMTFVVGLPLVLAGIGAGFVPLIIGVVALGRGIVRAFSLARDVTGQY